MEVGGRKPFISSLSKEAGFFSNRADKKQTLREENLPSNVEGSYFSVKWWCVFTFEQMKAGCRENSYCSLCYILMGIISNVITMSTVEGGYLDFDLFSRMGSDLKCWFLCVC